MRTDEIDEGAQMNVRVSTCWCAAAFVTGAVMAQTPQVTPEADATLNEVVVTGSRIRNGNNTPTPVTSVSNVDLQATTPTSIPDALQKLPAFTYTASPNSAVNANGRGFG